MKLLRFGEPGSERPGLLDDEGVLRDASTVTPDWTGPNLDPDRLRKLCGPGPGWLAGRSWDNSNWGPDPNSR